MKNDNKNTFAFEIIKALKYKLKLFKFFTIISWLIIIVLSIILYIDGG